MQMDSFLFRTQETRQINSRKHESIYIKQYSVSNISSPAIRAAMPWIFIGGETIGFAAIFALFLFMKVEKYSPIDHIAIRIDQGKEPTEEQKKEKISEKILAEFNAERKTAGKKEIALHDM